MAVQLVRKTSSDMLFKVISVTDDAIDWDKTYADEGDIGERQARHLKEHDTAALVFKDGAQPTMFVFDHPNRVDTAQKLRQVYARATNGKADADLFTEVYQKAFKGTEEGLDGGDMAAAPRRGGDLTKDFLQMLLDADVFDELALAFLAAANKPSDKSDKKK